MIDYIFKNGSTSNIIRFKVYDAASTEGEGLTGLTSASSGLIISTIADNEATATTYTVAGSLIETITTLGTYAAPTATKCRFKEIDATNHPGEYELHLADARFAVSSAKELVITLSGATDLVQKRIRVQLGLDTLTTQMTESYATDGTAPTAEQALFLIQQFLTEKSISSTTKTIKKLDGSTTAATFTLNSSTAPTSITRAT